MKLNLPDLKGSALLILLLHTTFLKAFDFNPEITSIENSPRPLVVDLLLQPSLYNGFNVSCTNSADGAIDLTPSNGTAPYTFLWSNGATTEDLTGLTAGTYTVTVTDFIGAIKVGSVTLLAPSVLVIIPDSTSNASCNSGIDGDGYITVNGGVQPSTFLWSDGSTNEDIIDVLAGTYTVTVTDLNGCQQQAVLDIGEDPFISLSISDTDIPCNGAATGAIDLTVSGGLPGFNYNWSNGATSQDLANLIAGIYTVTVTDANGCSESASTVISQNQAIQFSFLVTDVLCNGGSTGAIDLNVSGGLPNYSYLWSNGSQVQDPSGLVAGTYTVTVTDANNCTASNSAVLSQPSPIALSTSVTNIACNGGATGAIDLTPSGGTPGYTYLWSNGSLLQDPSGLVAGSYTVTVTDANNCTATIGAALTQPSPIALSTSVTNIACNGGATGAIDLTPSGGTPGYTYLWSNGSLVQDPSGLVAGTYTVTVTDANNCTATTSASLTQPSPIALSTSVTNIACNGGATGAINLTPSGGTPGYTYLWSNGSLVQDPSGLVAGTYTVTVTDANNCTATTSASLTQPSPIALSTSVTNIACNGGTTGAINLTPSGGTPGYTYLWSNGSLVQDPSGLIAGSYTVTVTDANNCTATTSAALTQPSPIALSTSVTNIACNGGATGAIDLTPSGGTPGYTYLWSNGSLVQDPSGLVAGTYTVTVTDANNCTAITSASLTQPSPIALSTSVTNIACNGGATGAINLTPSGGTPGYTYLWSNGSLVQDPSGLIAGTYTVTVTDANSCTASTGNTINQATQITLSFIPVSGTCNASNGSITVLPSGGTPGYSYQWNTGQTSQVITGLPAATYSVTITDAANCTVTGNTTVGNTGSPVAVLTTGINVTCNGDSDGSLDISVNNGTPNYTYLWSNGAVTQDIINLTSGSYTVTITDQNFCIGIFSFQVTQPQPISAPATIANVLCFGGITGAVDITVAGGTPGFTYLWSNGLLTQDISGLTAGTYTVTITDANLCNHNQSYIISQPSVLSVSGSSTQSVCAVATGTATATPSGGTPGYSYLWSNGATIASISGLTPATYTVTVTDANNCSALTSITVSATNAPLISNSVITDVTCNGGSDGIVNITVTGGSPSYTYLWSNGATTQDISGVAAGTYTVTVQDINGCSTSSAFTVAQAIAVSSSAVVTNALCNGGSSGAINITPSGGNNSYTYLWSNSSTTQDINSLSAATYTVTITDGNGCTGTSQYNVGQASLISFAFITTNPLCNGASTGSINLTMSGGTPGYIYLWSTGFTGEDPVNLSAGTYTVTVTDANSCTRSRSFTVTQPSAINASVNTGSATCNATNGTATIVASGGTGTLTYLWNTGSSSTSLNGLAPGTYTVTVTDGNLCTRTVSGIVNAATGPVISNVEIDSVRCNGGSNGAIRLTIAGGTVPLTYLWSNGATTKNIFSLSSGIYTVTVTDQNGCTVTASYTVFQPNSISASFTQTPASCGLPNGTLSVIAAGGTSPYTYQWSNGGSGNAIVNVIASSYTVTVTDVNNCKGTFSGTLNGVSGPVIDSSQILRPLCNGNANGQIIIYPGGGTSPLTYLWSNGATTQNINGLIVGTYTVTVSDGAGCTLSQSFTVTQPSLLFTPASTQPSFCGQTTGQAQVNPNGGTIPYTYLWNTGQTTQGIVSLSAGTYTVTVTDFNGCTKKRNVIVTLANGPVVTLVQQLDVTCQGSNNGSIDISVSGGTTPYNFLWSEGSMVEDVSNLIAGTYTVFVTDSTLCTDSAVFIITEPDTFHVVPVITNASCGLANGSISLTVSGATAPYSYLWNGGQSTSSISNLVPGTYTVIISDSNSCDTVLSFQVVSLSGPDLVLDSVRNVRCFGTATGRIFISVFNASNPVNFLWNDGNTSEDRFGLSAGTYTVIVTDAGGCKDSLTISLNQNTQITASFNSVQATCNQSNGSLTVSMGGGVGPYTLLWETGAVTATINNIAAGMYSVTITDSLGCTYIDSSSVNNAGTPVIQLQNQTQPLCFGSNNGSLLINISGGTPSYSVLWSNGDTGLTADSLVAGTYMVTVTDFNGCSANRTFVLGQPSNITLQLLATGAHCGQLNGSASVIAAGGTGNLTYLWSNNATSSSISNLSFGLYTVTVTDQNACTRKDTIRVRNIDGPQLLINQVIDVSCFGFSDGSVNVSVSSGVFPFQYIWSSGQITQDLNNIPAANYSVIVTDSAGCKDTLQVTVNQPSEILLQTTVIDASCGSANGSAFVTASGGLPGYTYLWSNGTVNDTIVNVNAGTYTVTVTDLNSCSKASTVLINNVNGPSTLLVSMTPVTCPGDTTGGLEIDVLFGTPPFTYLWSNGDTTSNLSGVSAGIYTLTVTDFNNCISLFSDTVTEPQQIQINAVVTNPSCNIGNGIIVSQGTGGTFGYTYLWSTGASSSTISGLNSGTYTLTVTDAAFCKYDSSFSILNTGIPVITVVAVDSVTCFGNSDGAIDLDISSGVPPYNYTWVNTSQTTQDVQNLSAGNYSVIVTDQRGCTASQGFNVNQPAELIIGFPVIQDAACGQSNGAIVADVTGGVATYSYNWSNGSGNDSLNNLAAGSYTLTVTDYNGCSKTAIANISNLTGPVVVSVDSSNISCSGGLDGSITVHATGVSLPLSYSWAGNPDTDSTLSNLPAGPYTLTITDLAGCIAVRTVTLTEPQPFTINSVIPQKNPPYNVSCFGLADGELYLSVNGGTPPYSFVWSNGAITQNLQNLTANVYTVFITDDNNCTTYQTFSLTQPQQLNANAGTDFILCGVSTTPLFADTPSVGIGYWQVVSSGNVLTFSDSTSPSCTIGNLAIGDNVLRWTVSDGICSNEDDVVVTVASEIEAIGGTNRKICGGEVNLNATRPEFGIGYWTALSSNVVIQDSSKAFTQVSFLNFGKNDFLWTVVNGSCRDSVVVSIFRRDSLDCLPDLRLPTAFSPNFDGSNDYLVIKGLEEYPDNEILIYNRWGQVVYRQDTYRNDWYGTDKDGYPLADGTYFLILKVRLINKIFNTYIDLRR